MVEKNIRLVKGLDSNQILTWFAVLSSVYRPSKDEKEAIDYIKDFVSSKGLVWSMDNSAAKIKDHKNTDTGNLLVVIPATKLNAQSVCLQCHVDMVCEPQGHDFVEDPIEFVVDGDWLKAKETSLGADNGIGVAAAMQIMDTWQDFDHGPIEILFTISEETGLDGAFNIDMKIESKLFLNLDSENVDEICVSCAGGARTVGKYEFQPVNSPANRTSFTIGVRGLRGGHSAINIVDSNNAIKILVSVLKNLYESFEISISSINGGTKMNAIPREAEAVIFVPNRCLDNFDEVMQSLAADLKPGNEENFELWMKPGDESSSVISVSDTLKIMDCLDNMTNGLIKMSDIPDLPQTSTNIGVIKTEGNTCIVETMQRSSVEKDLDNIICDVTNTFLDNEFVSKTENRYSGWAFEDTNLLKTAKSVYTTLFNEDAEIKGTHGGLECGIIKGLYPDMQIISIGPTIDNPHSPSERVSISSVDKFWTFLINLLKAV